MSVFQSSLSQIFDSLKCLQQLAHLQLLHQEGSVTGLFLRTVSWAQGQDRIGRT